MAVSTALLTSQADSHLPSALGPSFLGSRPPVWHGDRSLYDKGSPYGGGVFFHDYRNEAVSRATMPPYLYGCERTPYSARPDMVAADKVGNWERMLHQKRTHCSWIAPAHRAETDAFYMLCQQHRDQLRDHSGRLHPLDFFHIAEKPFHCPTDLFEAYHRYPVTFTQYRQPQSQLLTLGRSLPIPSLPGRALVGDFNQYPDTQWKGQSKMMFT